MRLSTLILRYAHCANCSICIVCATSRFDLASPWLCHVIRGSFYVLPVAAGFVITNACGLALVPRVVVTRGNVKNVNNAQCPGLLCPHIARTTRAQWRHYPKQRPQACETPARLVLCLCAIVMVKSQPVARLFTRGVHNQFNGVLRGSRLDQVAHK